MFSKVHHILEDFEVKDNLLLFLLIGVSVDFMWKVFKTMFLQPCVELVTLFNLDILWLSRLVFKEHSNLHAISWDFVQVYGTEL